MSRFSTTIIWGLFPLLFGFGMAGAQTKSKKALIPAGYWQFSESFSNPDGDQNAIWSFELFDDRSDTITAIGRRTELNGARVRDQSVAILFIDRYEDGSAGGTYIEAYGDGEQIELSTKISLSSTGKQMILVALDGAGKESTRFEGEWIGQGAKSKLQTGKWKVRQIVSPNHGGWDIHWNLKMSERVGKIQGSGNQVIVNGREAYDTEKRTYTSLYFARASGALNSISGSGAVVNSKGRKSKAKYEGWVSPSGRAFFVMSFEGNNAMSSLMVGRYQEE